MKAQIIARMISVKTKNILDMQRNKGSSGLRVLFVIYYFFILQNVYKETTFFLDCLHTMFLKGGKLNKQILCLIVQ